MIVAILYIGAIWLILAWRVWKPINLVSILYIGAIWLILGWMVWKVSTN